MAGVLGFVLFAASGVLRFAGAGLDKRGVPEWLLAGVMPLLATVGIAAIAFDQSVGLSALAVVLIAAGFALPYTVDDRRRPADLARGARRPGRPPQRLRQRDPDPRHPALRRRPLDGDGDIAFLAMAAFVAVGGPAEHEAAAETDPGKLRLRRSGRSRGQG